MAFTEQGFAMLSTVLNSEKAIQVNIEIMRAFANYRALLIDSKDFQRELKALDDKINQIFKFLLEKLVTWATAIYFGENQVSTVGD